MGLLHTRTVLTEFLLADQGDGWWHCPSPLRCEVIDGPASHPTITPSSKLWLVRTEPLIEWHGDESYIRRWGPDHPLVHPMDPTPYALVMATRRTPVRPDLGLLGGGVPAGAVLPSPEPTSVAEARTISGLWIKAVLRATR